MCPFKQLLTKLENIFSDGKNDEEYVTQYCGGLEDPRYEYEEGCDTIDIPYKTDKCYCRTGARWNSTFTLFVHFLFFLALIFDMTTFTLTLRTSVRRRK